MGGEFPFWYKSEVDGTLRDGSFASTPSELNLLLTGLKIAQREEEGKKKKKKKNLDEEKARNYWCLRRMGRDKAFLHRGVTRQWMHESGLFRSPLLELYSTLASWQKIAL